MEEVKPTKGLNEQPEESEKNLLIALNESNSIGAIALLRIYDVLMCLYAEKDPEDAKALVATHEAGRLRSSLPWLNLEGDNNE